MTDLFDNLARSAGTGISRRQALKAVGAGLFATVFLGGPRLPIVGQELDLVSIADASQPTVCNDELTEFHYALIIAGAALGGLCFAAAVAFTVGAALGGCAAALGAALGADASYRAELRNCKCPASVPALVQCSAADCCTTTEVCCPTAGLGFCVQQCGPCAELDWACDCVLKPGLCDHPGDGAECPIGQLCNPDGTGCSKCGCSANCPNLGLCCYNECPVLTGCFPQTAGSCVEAVACNTWDAYHQGNRAHIYLPCTCPTPTS